MPRNLNRIDYTKGLPEGFESFYIIEDPRSLGKTLHHFGELIFLCVTAILCGMNGFKEISHFGKLQIEWFRKYADFPNGIPTGQTLSNVFALIKHEQFNQCLIAHVNSLNQHAQSQIIAIDGKVLRGSNTFFKKAVHAVSAWSVEGGVTLAQTFVDEKSNEITAIPKLLSAMDLQNKIITIDAMGTQTEIADLIIENGGDYVLALKGNQGATHKAVSQIFRQKLDQYNLLTDPSWDSYIAPLDSSHGRETQRVVLACSHLKTVCPEVLEKWPHMQSIIGVVVQRKHKNSEKIPALETRYYISSLSSSSEKFHDIIKKHWSIENQCHWVMDVTFKQDQNQTHVGNAAKNLSTILRICHNTLKSSGLKGSLPDKRRTAAFDSQYRERLLGFN